MHGYGEYKWGDGRSYEGNYIRDKKHGFGKYTWADGRIYIGYWREGKQEGFGKYLIKSEVKFGFWENGKRMSWYTDKEVEEFIKKENKLFLNVLIGK